MKEQKIKLKDLHWTLKAPVILGWLLLLIYALAFFFGLFSGLLGL
jgi:hypothetical protein